MTVPALDPVIHQPVRLQIMAALAALAPKSPGLDFVALRTITRATDGNLGAHLAALEAAGYVDLDKQFVDRKPRTTARTTDAGRAAYSAHVEALRAIIGT